MADDPQGTKLGRIPSMKDDDQRRYPFRTTRPSEAPPIRAFKYHWTRWRPDQKGGTCVGHAVKQLRMSGPVTAKHVGEPSEYDVYDWAIKHDVWTDNDHDPNREFGTSVDAGMLAGREFGWWEGFEWCPSLHQMLTALQQAPVVMGTWWTDQMWDVDKNGFLHFKGNMVGGHAYMTYGYNLRTPYRVPGIGTNSYTIRHGVTANVNSWGVWGREGRGTFLLTFDDHESLIQADGECAVPVQERKLPQAA